MSGAIEPVDWRHSADELHERYKAERDLELRKRLGALWLVRRGGSVSSAAESMGAVPAHATNSLAFLVPQRRS